MSKLLLQFAFLSSLILIALACGGSDSDPAAPNSTITVEGSINETGNNLKPRLTADTSEFLIGTLVYLNSDYGTQEITFDGTSLNYSVTARASADFYIKIFGSGDTNRVYLSRFFEGRSNDIDSSNGQINAITTEHATRIETYLNDNFGATAATALAAVNSDMFDDDEFSFFGLNWTGLYNALTQSFQTFIDQRVADLATFDPQNPANYFIQYDNTSATVVLEFETADTAQSAAPAVLYAYNYPKATSTLSSDSVSYSVSLIFENESIDFTHDASNREVQFIADSAHAGNTLTLSITATAGNENTDTVNIFIDVKALQIDALTGSRIQLGGSGTASTGYSLLKGPYFSNDNFYVVVEKNGSYFIESYLQSDLLAPNAFGSSAATPADLQESYPLPRLFSDMIVEDDIAYLIDQQSAIVRYHLTLPTTSIYTSQTQNISATQLAYAGTTILAFHHETGDFYSHNTAITSDSANQIELSGSDNLIAQSIGSLGDYFYVYGTQSGNHILDFYSESFNYIDSYTTTYEYNFLEDQAGIKDTLYGTSEATATVLAISFSSFTATALEFQNSLTSTIANPILFNGKTMLTHNNRDSAIAFGFDSNSVYESSAFDNERVAFIYSDNVLPFATIINFPEGSSSSDHKSYFYLPGYVEGNTNTWYMKGYELSASP